ncbi:MAG TPA: SDR family NAD(P)-dependent oxidoreductase [Candidatus Limnocylindrales bacterium]|jgi:NAD(P)-dependent dehydrogenase (short-subunit alcohol dehydrogenase family)|nr:SDR family NAD(P)-dependent oxidoreductase [Candidatus Limnocylindrales bacterium]
MSELAGTVAVVTGAAGGLGVAIVEAFTAAGSTAVLLDANTEAVRAAAERHGALGIACDVTDAEALEGAAQVTLAEHGRCDILVNNAAILERAPLEEHPVELWDRVIDVNLTGYFRAAQAFGRLMREAGSGAIVNVASAAAEAPSVANGAYCASKAGVLALTRQIAVEWGPYGIRANAVSPIYMETPMTADIGGDPRRLHERTHNVPLGRIGQTREVAAVVVFLAGPGASYLNGINIPVDGALAQARAGGWQGAAS